ncbi:MAG: hypothetical protein ACJ783_04620 [Myxococcales bacterium]
MKKILVLSILAAALPAMASVGRIDPRPAAPREPMAAVEAAPKAEQPPRLIQLDRLAHTVMDGVTVMELDPLETGKHARRVVLRPDFQGGPGAALSVRF